MIAVDTNVLVYALHQGSEFRTQALNTLRTLAEGQAPWALPWPCVYECLRVVTHPQVYRPPLRPTEAWRQLRFLCASPSLLVLAETPRHGEVLQSVLEQSQASGNLVHDAHIWALCLEHGVSELISADRDMTRFHGMKLRNPFAAI